MSGPGARIHRSLVVDRFCERKIEFIGHWYPILVTLCAVILTLFTFFKEAVRQLPLLFHQF